MLPQRFVSDEKSELCLQCGSRLERKKNEKLRDWNLRKYCDRSCFVSHKNSLYVSASEMIINNTTGGDGCWEWQLYTDKKGYGRTTPYFGEVLTHRISYIEFVGPIPDGLHVLHSCDNPKCVNPKHLRVGTNDDNVADRHERGRWASMSGVNNPNWKHGRFAKVGQKTNAAS